jgi:CelD/BcsL family acetyltransferase involved in cellulose biosynthesis
MQVHCLHELSELAPYRDEWDRLAGDCTFRTWTWLSTWWRHYGGDGTSATAAERRQNRQLWVLLAFDCHEDLVGVLPCYLVRSLTQGAVLRPLGDGEVCSDHLGLLVDDQYSDSVPKAVAAHLAGDAAWDLLDFPAIDETDAATAALFAALGEADCGVAQYADNPSWAIDLPANWEEFLALQSKSHRKQLRQAERRVLDSGRAAWHAVDDISDFDAAWEVLVDLHQRRRQSLGEPGCFASPAWAAFHREVAPLLLAAGRLRLSWLELDGQPAAAEYHLAGTRTTFAYQGGVDPTRLDEEPGRLSNIRTIQRAMAEGHARFDFLRGDEPYKAHWRAVARPTWRRQAAAPRVLSKLRRQTWAGARRAGQLARQYVRLSRPTGNGDPITASPDAPLRN